ncbi:MAG: hypothetical protein M1826_005367 [Phylliscum demangeonii]|nr:MAG: hypothetical protein M1826_005367 [Phylliscum demangeonii]
MASPSKKKVTKKAAAKKAPAKKAPAKKAPAKKASAPAKKPTKPTTKKVATKEEGQPMARQLKNVTADFHYAVMTRGHGDCMYHAILDQLYGHQDAHAEVRATTVVFLRQHQALYGQELDQAFESYVERYVAKPGKSGGDLELQALAGAFLVDIVVYQDNHLPWRQEPMDGVLPAEHRPEDRKLLRVAYYGGVHYASVRPLKAAAPDSASKKRKQTPDGDPEEKEEEKTEEHEAAPRLPDPPTLPSPVSEPVAGEETEGRPRKKRAIAFEVAASPSPSSPPPVLQRQEQQPERATPPSPSTSQPPSKWRSASCPPSKGKAMAMAKAKRRPATRQAAPANLTIPAPALAPAAPAVPAVPAAAAATTADTSPAVPAHAPNDDKCRLVQVRLAGHPGREHHHLGPGEVLASYAVEEEG